MQGITFVSWIYQMPKYDHKLTYTIGECLLTYKILSFSIDVSKAQAGHTDGLYIIQLQILAVYMRQVGQDHMGIPPIIGSSQTMLTA